MNLRKILIFVASVIILILFILVSYISYDYGMNYGVRNAETIRIEKAKISEVYDKQIKSVLVKKVKNTKIRNKISSTGRAVSLNNITISSEVQGRLVGDNTFKKGTELKKGEIVFSVKDTDLKLLIEAKKSEFMSLLSSNLADISLDFNNEYIKWINFFNAIDLKKTLPDFPKMNSTKEKNYIISRSLLSQYLSIKSDEEKLNKYIVRAPFDGIITKSYSDVGGNVNPGTPVVDFIRKGKMEIELNVNISEIRFINIGDTVILKDNGTVYKGNVVRKGKFVNDKTQNISVFTSIITNNTMLYSGMYLNATIITEGTDNTFKLPRRSVFDGNKVYIIDSQKKLKIQEVDIIAFQGNEAIINNMPDNTLIVSEPLLNVNEESIVKAILK